MTAIAAPASAAVPVLALAVRVEQALQNAIMLVIAAAAAASAFTHVKDLSVTHGLPEWQGWANAIVVELIGVTAALELRRRRRHGLGIGFAAGVLAVAVLVSLACQVAEAEPSAWGWTLNAIPALGLLAVVKLVLGRTATSPPPTPAPVAAEVQTPDPVRSPAPPQGHVPAAPDRTMAPAPARDRPVDPDRGPRDRTAAPAGPDHTPDRDHGPWTTGPGRGPRDRTGTADQLPVPVPVPGPADRARVPAYAATLTRTQVHAVLDPDPRLAIAEALVRELAPDRQPGRREVAEAIRAAGHRVGTATAGDLLRQALAHQPEGQR